MQINQSALISLLSDLLVNISAGWFGIVLITPVLSSPFISFENVLILTKNFLFGIVFFAGAYWLKIKLEDL